MPILQYSVFKFQILFHTMLSAPSQALCTTGEVQHFEYENGCESIVLTGLQKRTIPFDYAINDNLLVMLQITSMWQKTTSLAFLTRVQVPSHNRIIKVG